MSAAGFRGRGSAPRGRKVRGPPSGLVGARIPQPNFNQPRRESHAPPAEFWLEHTPSVPWQQMNGLPPPQAQQYPGYESHRYRGGRPQFCPGIGARGRSKRVRGEGRPRPGNLPPPGFGGMGLARPELEPVRFPPLGSEEERQQKIAETADKLKQKLSSLIIEGPVNFWEENSVGVSFSRDDEHVVANRGIPELRHDPPELNLTVNDFKDIGRVDPDNCLNFGDSAELLPVEKSKSKVQEAEKKLNDKKIWLSLDHQNHKNSNEEITEHLNIVKNFVDNETAKDIPAGRIRITNNPQSSEVAQIKTNKPLALPRDEQLSSGGDNEVSRITEKKKSSELKPELTKSLEKLREVIKVDRELEKEGKSLAQSKVRTIFPPNAGPKLQPDVRLNFHPGIGPGYPRFQGFAHGGGAHDIRNRFPGSFRPEHPMEMQPNFAPEFQPRFDSGPRNFNIPPRSVGPRMVHSEFNGPIPPRITNRSSDVQIGYYPREPPPRFNVPLRQDHQKNPAWFKQNELPQKFRPQNNINGLQPPIGFDPRGPPPRFINQEQEMNVYGSNIVPPSEFSQIVPIGYSQVPHIHMGHQTRYFNPAMPPPNTAPCIIHTFPQPSVPPSSPPMENQSTLQPPPIPTGALDIQSHILCPPPSPPKLNQEILSNQNPTPNMNEELEDMQEALEFAKKLMKMTDVEDEDTSQDFDMPIFPDLPPIPSTEPSHLAEKLTVNNPGNYIKANIQGDTDDVVTTAKQAVEPDPQNSIDASIKKDDLKLNQKDEAQDNFPDDLYRRKVAFNLNSRTRKIAWKHQNDVGSSKNKLPSSLTSESLSEVKCDIKMRENKDNRRNRLLIRDDEKLKESKHSPSSGDSSTSQKENRVDNAMEMSSKVLEDNIKARPSSSSKTATKSLSATVVDTNWKDKVINQFLKMSKNDICNMVNSSGLRKFDIAMKHLVKERKYSLSQERRSSADDAVKGAYDMSREEFMSQLSAMLDPSATVDLKNLPSKFIQHLSEVLKLDVESHLNDGAEPVEGGNLLNSFGNTGGIGDDDNFFANSDPQDFRDSDFAQNYCTDESFGRNVETGIELSQDIQKSADPNHLFTEIDNGNNLLGGNLPNINAIDDIFSAGIARAKQSQNNVTQKEAADDRSRDIESEFISHGLIRARCTRTLMPDEHVEIDDLFSAEMESGKHTAFKNTEPEIATASEERVHTRFDGSEGWGRKKLQDPDMFRNLTKEEWEARCVRSSYSSTEKEIRNRSRTPSSRDTSLSTRSYSPRNTDRISKSHSSSRNLSPPSPLREKNYKLRIVVHTAEDVADKWSKATEDESLIESNSGGSSSCGSISSDSDQSESSNVTKLLKVIKESEKIAKDMSLNETIRDEIGAEINRTKETEREIELGRKCRRRDKNRKNKRRREKRRMRRRNRTDFQIDDVQVTPTNNNSQMEAFIKQEELIIEPDSEQFFETSNNLADLNQPQKSNSRSTVERNEETLSEMSFQENDEILGNSDGALNTQKMLLAQEYATRSTTPELPVGSSSLGNVSVEKSVTDVEGEVTLPAEAPLAKFEFKEIRNTANNAADIPLSKSGIKKIDIQAYKARKLQRNMEKQDKLKEVEAPPDSLNVDALNVQFSSKEAEDLVKETQKESVSEDARPRTKDKSEENNLPVNVESGLKKSTLIDGKDSLALSQHKKKIADSEVESNKRKDRRRDQKPSKETSTRDNKEEGKANSDEKVDKKRSRIHSRDNERSRSREDRRRASKEKSKHSSQEKRHDRMRSVSLDKSQAKATHQNNNIVESRDRKSTKSNKACDSPKEAHNRIEKHHSRSKKNLAEERSGDKEAKRKNECRQQSPGLIFDKIETHKRNEPEDDLAIGENSEPNKETEDIDEKYEAISKCMAEEANTAQVLVQNSGTTSTEVNMRDETGQATSKDTQITDTVDLSSSQDQNITSDHNVDPKKELTSKSTDPENKFHTENVEKEVDKDSGSREYDLIHKQTTDSSAPGEEISKLNILKDVEKASTVELHQTETLAIPDSIKSTENSPTHVAEAALGTSEFELEQSTKNELKSILNDLIEKAISQLDLLNCENEAKEAVVETEMTQELNNTSLKPELPTENERDFQESTEYNMLTLNSPETPGTPGSPLKGFSEESIKNSILGKRKLAQSVLEITEDYILNKKTKNLDDTVLDIASEGVNILDDSKEPLPKESLEEIIEASIQLIVATANSLENDVAPQESESKGIYETDEIDTKCVTPSGDTLSLGSSIDFDNGEFIVLSEISSDEDFSQDEDRKPDILEIIENQQSVDAAKPISEEVSEDREGEIEVTTLSTEETLTNQTLITSRAKNINLTKLEVKHSKLQMIGKDSSKSSTAQDNTKPSDSKNSRQSLELELNVDEKEMTRYTRNEDHKANVLEECLGESTEESSALVSEETQNSSTLVKNETSCELSSCKLNSKKISTIDEENGKRKVPEYRKSCKSEEPKNVNASGKDCPTGENNVDKNLHRVKHRHKMKRKKDKRNKLGEKEIKDTIKAEVLVSVVKKQQTREGVMARMVEIDLEIHKLMSEKMKLYEMLESGELPIEQSLAGGKNGNELPIETVKIHQREPVSSPSNNGTHTSSAKQKSSGSKNVLESSHSKSSKITASCASEDDSGNRHSGSQKDTLQKKSKKSHKDERPSRPKSAMQTESRKSSADRPVDTKISISRRKNTDEKSTSKKDSHSRSSSSSNRRKEEESLRKEEHGKKNVAVAKEASNEDENCQRSKKTDHHSRQRKKVNKIPDSKEDILRRVKKDGQLCSANDQIELRSETVCETVDLTQEKHPPQIYSEKSSQLSSSQEFKGDKKVIKGLDLLEETDKREKELSRKHKAVLCKGKKEVTKSLPKSAKALSMSEEEMPLDLLYVKKFNKKIDPLNNTKLKPSASNEVLEHILEAINAVAENKTDEYQCSNKINLKTEGTVEIDEPNIGRKAKLTGKCRPGSFHVPNSLHTTSAADESQVVWPTEDILDGIHLEDLTDLDNFNVVQNFIASKSNTSTHESHNKFPVDKIVEISRKNTGVEMAKNESIAKSFEKTINETVKQESGKDILRLKLCDSESFNYLDDVPQFDESSMPQDPTTHSHSISHNINDIEKGLDVLDSMIETVSSDVDGISSKDVPSSSVKKGKRKRMVSGNSDADCNISSRQRKTMTKSEMMNCSIRLIDCKYTHPRNCLNSGAELKGKIFTADKTNDLTQTQNATDSHPQRETSQSPVSQEKMPRNASPDWSPKKDQFIDGDENLHLLNNEPYLTAESDLSLNHIEGNSEYDEDDLEIMKLNPSSHGADDIIETFCSTETFPEVDNWHSLDGIEADGFVLSDSEQTNSPRLSSDCPIAEISELRFQAKSFPKLMDSDVNQDPEIGKLDHTNDEILTSENSIIGEKLAAAKCTDDIQVINLQPNEETNEVQEVELPRIQYSVHKGPILDVKVFGDSILAASEDGIVYRYSQTCNGILNTYEGHKSAVTCIYVLQGAGSSPGTERDWLFSGSLDGSLRCFDIMTSYPVRGAAEVGSSIQCMDQSWGTIFLGTKSGNVFRFHIKTHVFKGDEIKFSEESVLALKATTEGPRRVLIVASRSQPITIRDAQSGLFLRTVSGHKSHTVYSLMMDSNLVYCGTSSTAIPVFDFINGSQVKLYNAGPGIVCMRMYKWLLFAGCYDGNIYVFDTKEQRLVCSIPGPGNMLLSMDIVRNKIVAGSKDRRLHMWQMPEQVLTILAGRT